MPPVVNPRVVILVGAVTITRDVASLVAPMMVQLPEALLAEAKLRAINVAVQYGTMAAAQSGIGRSLDPLGPLPYFNQSYNWLLSASSPEEAASRGIITLGVFSLSFASSADTNTSGAFGAFLIIFLQNVLFPGSGMQVISDNMLVPFILNKIICRAIIEIQVELKRKKLKLRRKFPSIKNIQWKKLFKKSKNQDKFYTSVLRIRKRKLKLFSRQFSIYLPYEKRVLLWKRSPMVEPIFL
jgi:hypothetical protein